MSEPVATGPKAPPPQWIPTPTRAARIVLWYVVLSALWIFWSGVVLRHFVHNLALAELLENIKGWFFVVVTALLLGWVLSRYFREIRHSAQRLQESEARLRLLGDNLPDSYVFQYTHDADEKPRFTYISAGVERVHAVPVNDVLRDANCLLAQMKPAQRQAFAAAVMESARRLTNFEMRLQMRRADGKARVLSLRAKPRRNGENRIWWDGFAQDITELTHAESVLREREEQLRLFVEHSPAAIAMLDCNMRYLVVSRRWVSDYRLNPQEIIGQSHYEIFPEIPESWKEIHRRCLAGVVAKSDADQFLRADGSMDWVRWEIHPWRTDQGAIGGLIIFSEVITERKQAAEALQRTEENYREIFNATNEAIFLHDAVTGQVVDVNDAMLRMHGYNTKEEFLSNKIEKLMANDRLYNWQEAQRRMHLAVEQGPQIFEWLSRKKNGERFWTEVSLRSSQIGGQGRILAVVRDITTRKQWEAALRESEEQFRAMFEMASIGMAQVDPHTGQWVRVNQKMCQITGYSAAEMLQLRVPEITHPEDRTKDWEAFQRVVRGEVPDYCMEKRYLRKDGKVAWVNVNVTVIRNPVGQPTRTIATIEDISARKQAEEERLRLVTAMEQSAESIMITDTNGTLLYVNPAFEQISGYSRQEVVGKNPRLLKSGRQDTVHYKRMWETLKHGEVWRGRLVNKRKDGTLYEEDATISPVRDAAGRVVNYVAIKLDVTREIELETQLRQAQKMEAIGQLAGGVAHDFNNILGAIIMQADLAAMTENLPEETQEGLQQIRSSAECAASLTRQLLLFSRKQVMQPCDLDLNEVVTNLAKMLQRIIGEDVRLQLHLYPTPLMLHADAGMLDQVLMNLAVNARDAMPGGGRLLIETGEKTMEATTAQLQPDAASGPYVWLRVTDSGCGIPPEVLPRIFEPFFTTKDAGKGTGLGLATVFGIIKQHGGWINLSSERGRGTHFEIFLPACKSAPAITGQSAARSKPRGGRETILLSEDDAPLRRMARMLLERNGYTVLEAANGVEALKIWEQQCGAVALLLADLVMPAGMSGKELAQKLQADKPEIKVIFVSGYSAELAGREIHLQNGECFMQKPFEPDQLLETIRRCLDS